MCISRTHSHHIPIPSTGPRPADTAAGDRHAVVIASVPTPAGRWRRARVSLARTCGSRMARLVATRCAGRKEEVGVRRSEE